IFASTKSGRDPMRGPVCAALVSAGQLAPLMDRVPRVSTVRRSELRHGAHVHGLGDEVPAMKIATYNVNGVNGRLPVLLRWLAEAEPDVVCLQELKAPQDKFPEPALRQAGYNAVWHGQKSWNGVAILARSGHPIETRRGLPGD